MGLQDIWALSSPPIHMDIGHASFLSIDGSPVISDQWESGWACGEAIETSVYGWEFRTEVLCAGQKLCKIQKYLFVLGTIPSNLVDRLMFLRFGEALKRRKWIYFSFQQSFNCQIVRDDGCGNGLRLKILYCLSKIPRYKTIYLETNPTTLSAAHPDPEIKTKHKTSCRHPETKQLRRI